MPEITQQWLGDWVVTFKCDDVEAFVVDLQLTDEHEIMAVGFDRKTAPMSLIASVVQISTDVVHMAQVKRLAFDALRRQVSLAADDSSNENDLPF